MVESLRKRLISLLIPTVVLIVLVHEVLTTPVYTDRELSAMREAAVARARSGQYAEALEHLKALSVVAPGNRLVWGDYLVVMIRAGRPGQAIDLARASPKRALPDYALAALFTAALDRHDWPAAEQFAAREKILRPQLAAGRQQALARARDEAAAQAASVAASPPAAPSPETRVDRPVLPAQSARVALSVRRHRAAPPAVPASAVAAAPSRPAAQAAPKTVAVASAGDNRAARDAAAIRARDAVRAAEDAPPAARAALARRALQALDDYQTQLGADAPARLRRDEQLDRVRALTLAGQLDAAAALFDTLQPDAMPLYGLMNGADLFSRRHQPERTAALLVRADRLAPNAPAVLRARFYNQLDREDYAGAAVTLQRLQVQAGRPADRRGMRELQALFAAYRNRLDSAQRQLEALHRQYPGDAGISQRLAQIYRWRGWPRRALALYRSVEPAAGDPIEPRLGVVASLTDLQRFGDARRALQVLTAAAPEHPGVERALADQQLRNRSDYSAQFMRGRSTGGPITTNGDLSFDQRLYLPPIADQYRVFAHQRYDWADLPEGRAGFDRVGVGGDYRSQSFDVAVELGSRMPSARTAAILDATWHPADTWSLSTNLQTDSTEVPLRALHAGVHGYSFSVGGVYQTDESHRTRLVYTRAAFSDGNRRDMWFGSYRQAFYHSAHHQLAASVQAYYAANTAGSDVPYYNPDSESSLGGNLEYNGVLWRRYDHSWSQRLTLGLAGYREQGYGSSPIWDAEYEQRWAFGPTFSFHYGLLYRSRVYDGGREAYRAVFGGLAWRF